MKFKSILSILVGLIILYFVISFSWSLLNTQTCSFGDLPKNASCEQIAENDSKNCKYAILKWKTVDYNTELQKCREWEKNNK